ncbi:MAG: hypothetical protein WDZ47_08175 [Bacteroidales bacterium]
MVVVLLSAQPFMSALVQEKAVQEKAVQEQNTDMLCCNEQTDCCGNSDRDADDTRKCDSEQDCTDKCQCVTHSQTVNAIAERSPQYNMFRVYIEAQETLSTPYHLILPVSIWRPPQS